MKVTGWKANEKGTLRGFFSLLLDSGLQIDGMSYHEKEGKPGYLSPRGRTKARTALRNGKASFASPMMPGGGSFR